MTEKRQQVNTRERLLNAKKPNSQSRIGPYIEGKAELREIYNCVKIIKPENRHNKRAFLQRMSPGQQSTVTQKSTSLQHKASKKKPSSKLDNKNGTVACNSLSISAISGHSAHGDISNHSHVSNNTSTSTSVESLKQFYERLLAQKDAEILAFRDQVQHLHRNLELKLISDSTNEVGTTISNLLRSLSDISEIISLTRTTTMNEPLDRTLARMENIRNNWYNVAASLSTTAKTLYESNQHLHQLHAEKDDQLSKLKNENTKLQERVAQIEDEIKKYDELGLTVDNVITIKNNNEKLRSDIKRYEQLGKEGQKELNICLFLHEEILNDIRIKESKFREIMTKMKQLECEKTDIQINQKCYEKEFQNLDVEGANENLKAKLQQLQDDKESIRTNYNECQKLLVTINSKYERLLDEYEHLQKKNSQLESALLESGPESCANNLQGRKQKLTILETMFETERKFSAQLMKNLEQTVAKIIDDNEIHTS